MPTPSGPLAGIRILDAATFLAAPYAASLMSEYGAEVIKVEEPKGDWAHAMTRQFLFDAAEAVRLLKASSYGGEKLMFVTLKGNEVFGGCGVYKQAQSGATMTNAAGDTRPFSDCFYIASGGKSGMHHPDGIFWIRDSAKKPSTRAERISLRRVAPTLLGHFGIPRQEHMSMGAVPAYQVEETSERPLARV